MGESDAWSLFWRRGLLDSCLTGDDPVVEAALSGLWSGVAAGLKPGAHVLDLATGNGAVPVRLAKGRQGLHITGVDLASVVADGAVRRVAEQGSRLDVRAGTDITALPFPDARFDLVTSQFGFEYAPRAAAVHEAMRVLVPGGRLECLIHHTDGLPVGRNVGQVAEIDRLLAPHGVIEALQALMATGRLDGPAAERLETAGKAVMAACGAEPPRITAQVFGAIGQLLAGAGMSPDYRAFAARDLEARLLAERERMNQLRMAACSEADMASLATLLADAGAETPVWRPLTVGPEAWLAGWHLSARKRA